MYSSSGLKREWDEATRDVKVELKTRHIVIGSQGAALNVQSNSVISEWYNAPESVPHITLLVNENFESKELGPMMRRASQVEWEKTDNPLIYMSQDGAMIKITCELSMTAHPQVVTITKRKAGQNVVQEKESENMLMEDTRQHVPDKLWSKHDADVGLVKSANPVEVG